MVTMDTVTLVLQIAGALLGIPFLTFLGGGLLFAAVYIFFGPKPNQTANQTSIDFAVFAGSSFALIIGAPSGFAIGIGLCLKHLPMAVELGWPVVYGCLVAAVVWAVMLVWSLRQ